MKSENFADSSDVQNFLQGSGYELQDLLDSCQYFVAFYLPEENDAINIVHFVNYVNRPTENDILSAYEELSTDEEFGLLDCSDDLNHHVFTRVEVEQNFPEILKVAQ